MSRQVNFDVSDVVYERLGEMAKAAGLKPSSYARMLFEVAYAARWNKSGDAELEAKVGCAVVLHAARQDTATIARALALQESTVVKIIDAWRAERAAA
jgi:hypothetical protein